MVLHSVWLLMLQVLLFLLLLLLQSGMLWRSGRSGKMRRWMRLYVLLLLDVIIVHTSRSVHWRQGLLLFHHLLLMLMLLLMMVLLWLLLVRFNEHLGFHLNSIHHGLSANVLLWLHHVGHVVLLVLLLLGNGSNNSNRRVHR